MRSGLKVPTFAMPIPDLAVPYAAPTPVSFSVYSPEAIAAMCMHTSKDHGEGDAAHSEEGRKLGCEL